MLCGMRQEKRVGVGRNISRRGRKKGREEGKGRKTNGKAIDWPEQKSLIQFMN